MLKSNHLFLNKRHLTEYAFFHVEMIVFWIETYLHTLKN
jgi:hypothetical protein